MILESFVQVKSRQKKSLKELVKFLRFRGLNIQTEKTDILSKDEAIKEVEGIQPIIREITKKYEDEIAIEFDNPYMNFFEFEKVVSNNFEDTPIEVIKIAFENYFVQKNITKFNKTLFRFLLKRLSKFQSKYAVKHCLYTLESNPEETQAILNYFKQTKLHEDAEEFSTILHFLSTYLGSERSIYQYQNYLVIKYLEEIDFKPTSNILKIVRNIVFEKKSEIYLMGIGLKFLSKYGNHTDFEKIEYEFHSYHHKIQVEAILALKSMEKTKRNSFYARIGKISFLHEKAVSLAKGN